MYMDSRALVLEQTEQSGAMQLVAGASVAFFKNLSWKGNGRRSSCQNSLNCLSDRASNCVSMKGYSFCSSGKRGMMKGDREGRRRRRTWNKPRTVKFSLLIQTTV